LKLVKRGKVYDLEKYQSSADKYNLYLSGPTSIITIDNPNTKTKKELNSLLLKVLEGATSWKALEPLRAIGVEVTKGEKVLFFCKRGQLSASLNTAVLSPL